MASDLSPVLQTAREMLKESGRKGMHAQDIARAAVAANKNMGLTEEDFYKKVQSALAANLKLKTAKPAFTPVKWEKGPRKGKPKQGWYRLREERIPPVADTVKAPQAGSIFFGKAGEFAVMSELLFWGFNASIMTVDDGIDIVAGKHGKFFHIQVKTAKRQENGKYQFTLNSLSFKKYHAANVFYAFVLRQETKNEYIIIPSMHLDYFINAGFINNSSTLSVTISTDPKNTKYQLNSKVDVTPFYGKFGEIIV